MNRPVAKPRSRDSIINYVQNIKKRLRYDGLGFPVCTFIENIIQAIDPNFSYEYVENSELPENTYAYYDPINNIMKIDENVYCRALKGSPRDIFTIAHEIGHYFLVDEIAFARSENEKIPAYMDPEWQANTFAAELLMPSDKILGMSIGEIMRTCHVSKTAAGIAHKNAKKPNYFLQ